MDYPREYQPKQLKNGTKLPLKLIRKCINYSTKPADLVLDPFTGNATTQIGAKGEFCHFLGFEINPNMKEIIDFNLSDITAGQFYHPYCERIPSIKELSQKYPNAYKVYLKRKINVKKKGLIMSKES